jgi:hypothetical protein
VGLIASGAWQRTPYYEPVRNIPEENPVASVKNTNEVEIEVPKKKRFLFFSLPWKTTVDTGAPQEGDAVVTDDEDAKEFLLEALGKNLTLGEQMAVMRIVLTRFNGEERGRLLELARGNVTMTEAFEAYKMLRERLTEEEMALVLGLMQKHRSELEELIRK